MIKKIISLILVLYLCFSGPGAYFVYAQEESPSSTPEETVLTQPTTSPSVSPSPLPDTNIETDNTADVENNIDSTAITGENEIVSPSLTPTPTPVINGETEDVEETLEVETSPTSTPSPATSIETGDSVAVTEVQNDVNTNIVNSTFVNHTLNIFLSDQVLDLDLSLLTENAVNKVYGADESTSEDVSVVALGINNFAYVVNNVKSVSNTGGNNIEGGGSEEINSGDAYSIISILNNVNTNIVDSTLHFLTINIFGGVKGNIILPEFTESGSGCCGVEVDLDSSATVKNNVDSSAVTGQNTIETTGSGEINTGDAQSVVNVYNLVNTNYVGVVFKHFIVNTFGEWIGEFLGWGDILATDDKNLNIDSVSGGQDQSCEGCFNDINIQNRAEVVNNISSTSNTGNNTIVGENGKIITGNAFSSVTLINLINSNIINSQGFIGFVNIFGYLTGDIGGADEFVELEDTLQEESILQSNTEEGQNEKQPGGQLVLEASHNVGAYVLPGDTVTFTAKVKNPGYGKLYETKVFIELFKNGNSYGGAYFDLGEINPNQSLTLSTGIVLSKKAESGIYDAVVTATGIAGSNENLKQSVTLPFRILGYGGLTGNNQNLVAGATASDDTTPPAVLGTSKGFLSDFQSRMIAVFSALLLVYLLGRGYQKREIYVYPVAKKLGDYALRIGSLLS